MPYRLNAITGELDLVLSASSMGGVSQIDGDTGSATPVGGVVNIVGEPTQGVSTSGIGDTLVITVDDSSTTQKGVIELATAAETTTGTSATLAVAPSTLNTKLGTQTTNGVIYGQGGAGTNLASLAEAADGQLIIGSTGNAPVLATLTAGSNISIANGAGSITISANGGGELAVTALTNASSPYVVLSTDEYLSCDVSLGVLTIRLPDAPTTGRVVIVKDSGGDSATNNITVTTVGGAVNIDGATTFVMNTAYEATNFLFNGTSYEVF